MIVRILKGVVAAEKVDQFHDHASAALATARTCEGLLYGEVGRQVTEDCGEEIVFVTVWRDLDALYDWMGHTDLLTTPMISDCPLFEELDVQHYETWAEHLAPAGEVR